VVHLRRQLGQVNAFHAVDINFLSDCNLIATPPRGGLAGCLGRGIHILLPKPFEESKVISVRTTMKFAPGLLALALVTGSAKAAKSTPAPLPAAYSKLAACKTIVDRDARLACYDKEAIALEQAIVSKEVLVADKAQVKEARRGLFGFSLPKISLFGSDEAEEQANEIEATIARAIRLGRNGPWTIILEDGAKWVQLDGDIFPDPKPGQKIRIRKGAIGSYFANVNGQRAVRVKRQN
jgi:hypothetical protein